MAIKHQFVLFAIFLVAVNLFAVTKADEDQDFNGMLHNWNENAMIAVNEWSGKPADKWSSNVTELSQKAYFFLGRAGQNRRMRADLQSRLFKFNEKSLSVNFTLTYQISPVERCLFEFQLRDHSNVIVWYKNSVMGYTGRLQVESFAFDIQKLHVYKDLVALNFNFACFNQAKSNQQHTAIISNFQINQSN